MKRYPVAFIAGLLPVLVLLLSIQTSRAGSAKWNLNPISGDWNTATVIVTGPEVVLFL